MVDSLGPMPEGARAKRWAAVPNEIPAEERHRLARDLGRALRYERGAWSHATVASLTGLGLRTVQGLEVGDRRPSATTLWRLARVFARGRDDVTVAIIALRLFEAAGSSVYARDRLRVKHRRLLDRAAQQAERTPSGFPVHPGDTPSSIAFWELGVLPGSTPKRYDAGRDDWVRLFPA